MSDEALQELNNIANAKRFDRETFVDDTEFADWAQSRARHTLARAASTSANVAQQDEDQKMNTSDLISTEMDSPRRIVLTFRTAAAAEQFLATSNAANVAQGAEAVASLRRIAHELRTYNPADDEYKGEHIHKVWARGIEALLSAASNGEPK